MIAAQTAHAAGSGSERHPPNVHVVVLAVSCEGDLRTIHSRLCAEGIPSTLVVESDPPYRSQAMSIGLELVNERKSVRRVLGSLPLLGKGAAQIAA